MSIQQEITKWADETFGVSESNFRTAVRVNEEMAELLTVVSMNDDPEKIAEEVADVMIVLYRLATQLGVDLDKRRYPEPCRRCHVTTEAAMANTQLAMLLDCLEGDKDTFKAEAQVYMTNMARDLDYLACAVGLDLNDEVWRKMLVNRSRKWVRDGSGHGYHE